MKTDEKFMKELEELSGLSLSEDQRKKAVKDMTDILNYIDIISELDTDLSEQNSQKAERLASPQADNVEKSSDRNDILKNSPDNEDGYFIVPAILQ